MLLEHREASCIARPKRLLPRLRSTLRSTMGLLRHRDNLHEGSETVRLKQYEPIMTPEVKGFISTLLRLSNSVSVADKSRCETCWNLACPHAEGKPELVLTRVGGSVVQARGSGALCTAPRGSATNDYVESTESVFNRTVPHRLHKISAKTSLRNDWLQEDIGETSDDKRHSSRW